MRERFLVIADGVIADGDFETNRFAEHAFERRDVTVRGPHFQFRVAGGAESGQVIIYAGIEIDPGQRLRVAAVESFRQSNHGRQRFHRPSLRPFQIAVAAV
jgi:hypothetical protein